MFIIFSITTTAIGAELKRSAATRKVIIAEALTNQIPPVLHTIVIQYAMCDYHLQSIAFLDLHAQSFSVIPGEENLSRNRFYTIRHEKDGLIAYCIRVAKQGTDEAIALQGNNEYHVYQESDNAYTAIAKKCKVPAWSLVLYARQVPFLYRLSPSRGLDYDDKICTMLWADSAKNVSRNDPEYIQARKQSTLFFAPDTTFKDFCVALTKEYHRCKEIPHRQKTPQMEYSISDYDTAYPAYIQAAQNQSPQQGILLKRENQFGLLQKFDVVLSPGSRKR